MGLALQGDEWGVVETSLSLPCRVPRLGAFTLLCCNTCQKHASMGCGSAGGSLDQLGLAAASAPGLQRAGTLPHAFSQLSSQIPEDEVVLEPGGLLTA